MLKQRKNTKIGGEDMTKSGIETDLQHSPYKFYKEDFTFYFSSERYRDKYIEALPTAIEAIGIRLAPIRNKLQGHG